MALAQPPGDWNGHRNFLPNNLSEDTSQSRPAATSVTPTTFPIDIPVCSPSSVPHAEPRPSETLPSLDRLDSSAQLSSFSSPPRSEPGPNSFSSPLSERTHVTAPSPFCSSFEVEYDYEYQGSGAYRTLLLKPTVAQWADFPAILETANRLGAAEAGCFKVYMPGELRESLPPRSAQAAPANAYRVKPTKPNGFWQVTTVPSEGIFSPKANSDFGGTVHDAMKRLKRMFNKQKNRQLRDIRYRVDIPAWTQEQRQEAGVPSKSPIHPLKGDRLDHTKAIVPGIHTPYVYESGPAFGALFQIHAEDFRLHSLNHLYRGRKIWVVLPASALPAAEVAFGRGDRCAQFMRHRAEFFFPDKLDKMKIPYRIIDQRPGETIVILPDAYHEGFSTGYTIAEAKNYAEEGWSIDTYQPCEDSCDLPTAILASHMQPLDEGQVQIDLCAQLDEELAESALKRDRDSSSDDDVSDDTRPRKKLILLAGGKR